MLFSRLKIKRGTSQDMVIALSLLLTMYQTSFRSCRGVTSWSHSPLILWAIHSLDRLIIRHVLPSENHIYVISSSHKIDRYTQSWCQLPPWMHGRYVESKYTALYGQKYCKARITMISVMSITPITPRPMSALCTIAPTLLYACIYPPLYYATASATSSCIQVQGTGDKECCDFLSY